MIHIHVIIKEHGNLIAAEAMREVSKTETEAEIRTANKLLAFIQSGMSITEEPPQKDPGDWWKNDDGEPPYRRN